MCTITFLLSSLLHRQPLSCLLDLLVDLKESSLTEELPRSKLRHLLLLMVRSLPGQPRHLCHTIDLVVENTSQATLCLGSHQELTDLIMLCSHRDIRLLLHQALILTLSHDVYVPICHTLSLQDLATDSLDNLRAFHYRLHLFLEPMFEERQ